jgi:hypothetical protein
MSRRSGRRPGGTPARSRRHGEPTIYDAWWVGNAQDGEPLVLLGLGRYDQPPSTGIEVCPHVARDLAAQLVAAADAVESVRG